MSLIKEIRELTGLSQYKLADWLGVSRGLVNLAEKDQRGLPRKASMKLYAMSILIQRIQAATEGTNQGQPHFTDPAKLASMHKKKMEFYQKNAASLQAQLDKLKRVHPKIKSRLALMDALNNNDIAWFTKTEPDNKWIELTEFLTKERIAGSGHQEQEILQDKIDTKLAYAEVHKNLWEKYSGK